MSILFSQFFEKINKILPLEADFTSVLESIALKPKTLYYNGKLPENVEKPGSERKNSRKSGKNAEKMGVGEGKIGPGGAERPKTVAIVGARRNTAYGEEVAYQMAYKLAQRGVVVVSGLAYGIDSIAHRGAVDAGGVTIGVLGTPIGEIYPRGHTGLAKRMIELGGAVMSEYGPDDSPEGGKEARARFLMRNRLIAGLADVVVVVEAAEHSGSLNTATHALEQGKDLFAVPGNITNPMSQGCNRLIYQGAMPYTGVDDILNLLFPPSGKQMKMIFGDNPEEVAILKALDAGIRDGEAVIKATGMDAAEFNRTITMLEIKGAVKGLGCNKWAIL